MVQIKDANSFAPQLANSFVNRKAINQAFLFPEERDCQTEQEVNRSLGNRIGRSLYLINDNMA